MPVTVKTSPNGKVILVQRVTGFAVSVREQVWGVRGASHFFDWNCKGKGLTLDAAESLFAKLAA